jgi:flagellar protein FliJ
LRERCRRAAGPGPVDIDQLVEAQRYELTLKAQLQHLQHQRELLAAEIERRRLALVEANRAVRVMEKLRERQAQRYAQEEYRRDLKEMNEVARQRALREEV